MRDVALISELSHHKLKDQKDEYPDMQHFLAPDEISALLRPTTRKDGLNIHVVSLSVIADKKQDFVDFVQSLPKDATIISKQGDRITRRTSLEKAEKLWGMARRKGASAAGGIARSDQALLEFWAAFSAIKDRWHGAEKSKDLMKEAKIKHHDTFRVYLLYTRWQWRRLSDAQRRKTFKRLEKEVRECLKNQ